MRTVGATWFPAFELEWDGSVFDASEYSHWTIAIISVSTSIRGFFFSRTNEINACKLCKWLRDLCLWPVSMSGDKRSLQFDSFGLVPFSTTLEHAFINWLAHVFCICDCCIACCMIVLLIFFVSMNKEDENEWCFLFSFSHNNINSNTTFRSTMFRLEISFGCNHYYQYYCHRRHQHLDSSA